MFGAFLGVGQQFAFECLIFLVRRAAAAGAGEGADGDDAVAQADEDFG